MVEKTTTRGSQVFKHVVKKKHQPEVFDDLLGSPRQYMIIFFIVLNHPKKCYGYHGLGWLRRQFFRPSHAPFLCVIFVRPSCAEPLSVPHQVMKKTTKPSKIRLVSEYVKKT